jgi:hypothetical protein
MNNASSHYSLMSDQEIYDLGPSINKITEKEGGKFNLI